MAASGGASGPRTGDEARRRDTDAVRLTIADRLRAWLVTGPLGRLAALAIELAAAAGRGIRRRR